MTAAPPETTSPSHDVGDVTAPRRRPRRSRPPQRDHERVATTVPSALMTRLGHVVLWLLVAGGAGAGVAALALHASNAAAPTPVAPPPTATTPAEGFAELYVAAYLSRAGHGTEDTIAAFYPATVTLPDVTAGAVWVLATTAVAADEQHPGYWAVTVAAEVLTATDDGWEPAPLRYYTVGVAETNDALAATGLPGQVAAPPPAADAPELAVASLSAGGDEPGGEAVASFLAAYLAGDGELDRYTAPEVDLVAIDPAPFTDVEVSRIGAEPRADGRTLLRAEVTATDAAGLVQVLEYSIDVIERDGRVEVAALHPAPPLATPAAP